MPLYARALATRRKRPMLVDPKAVEIVDSIDWDFRRIAKPRRMAGCVLRCALFDVWVREFLQRHPDGTVVEIGAGLNTRFERLDNGRVHWFDLDRDHVKRSWRRASRGRAKNRSPFRTGASACGWSSRAPLRTFPTASGPACPFRCVAASGSYAGSSRSW